MKSTIYEILESLHEDTLKEQAARPTAFTGQVLRSVGEALSTLERTSDASQRHSVAARKGWAARRSGKSIGEGATNT